MVVACRGSARAGLLSIAGERASLTLMHAYDLALTAPIELDQVGEGEPTARVKSRIARFDKENAHGNILRPQAVDKAYQVQLSAYDHDSATGPFGTPGRPPVGAGVIEAKGDWLVFDGEVNLTMDRGRELYQSLRFSIDNGVPVEWSYGFRIEKARPLDAERPWDGSELLKVTPKEASPVYAGANEGSRTLQLNDSRRRELFALESDDQRSSHEAMADQRAAHVRLTTLRRRQKAGMPDARRTD